VPNSTASMPVLRMYRLVRCALNVIPSGDAGIVFTLRCIPNLDLLISFSSTPLHPGVNKIEWLLILPPSALGFLLRVTKSDFLSHNVSMKHYTIGLKSVKMCCSNLISPFGTTEKGFQLQRNSFFSFFLAFFFYIPSPNSLIFMPLILNQTRPPSSLTKHLDHPERRIDSQFLIAINDMAR